MIDTIIPDDTLPGVSVVIPIYNEGKYLRLLFESFAAQTYPKNRLQIILVDGMSNDGTREMTAQLRQEYLEQFHCEIDSEVDGDFDPVQLIDNPRRIVPCAMNEGIRAASFDIVLRMDGHTIVSDDYVERTVESYIDLKAGNIGGIVVSKGRGLIGKAIAHVMSSRLGIGNSAFRTTDEENQPCKVDTVPFGIFSKDLLRRIGLFDERFVRHQDYELNYRIRNAGFPIYLVPSITSNYYVRDSVIALVKQYFQYGFWKGRFLRLHPQSLKIRHLIPPAVVVFGSVALVLAYFSAAAWSLFLALLILYSLYLIVSSVHLAGKHSLRYLILYPLILSAVQLPWGLGVVCGSVSPRLSEKTHKLE